MKAATFATLLLVPLLAAGCDSILGGDEEGDVTLSVEGDPFHAGDVIAARVRNGTDDSVVFNTCFTRLDARIDDGWVETDYLGDVPCPAIDPFWPGLAPGRSSEFTPTLPETVPAGTYRLRLQVWERQEGVSFNDEGEVYATSPGFEVRTVE